jgi:predicted polyphosphate/ATP-dependent NAD kinase
MQKEFDKLTPLPDGDPYVFHELLVNELKADTVYDMDGEQFQALIMLIKQYRQMIQIQEEQALQMQMLMASIQNATQLEGAMAVQNFNQPQE